MSDDVKTHMPREVNAGDLGKALWLFQGDLENRIDIKRMGLESFEVKAFKRLVLDGLDSDGIVLEGRGGDKAQFTDKSEFTDNRECSRTN
ncbi:MAG: hypothetical protein QM498_02880 [Desulfobacterium sp.]